MELIIDPKKKIIYCTGANSQEEFEAVLKVVQKEMHEYPTLRLKTKEEIE